VLFALASVAGIYTHLTMVFVRAGQLLAVGCATWLAPDGQRVRWQPWFWTGAPAHTLLVLWTSKNVHTQAAGSPHLA
jgi:hypothetical protein